MTADLVETPDPLSNALKTGKKILTHQSIRALLRVFFFIEFVIFVLYLTNEIFLGFNTIVNPIRFHGWVWEVILDDFTFGQMMLAAMPILVTAVGATFNERVGVINIGLEGIMVSGAFTAVYVTYLTGNPWLGALASVIAGAFVGLLHAIMTITFKAEQIVTGVAINLLALGMTQVLTLIIWNRQFSPTVQKFDKVNIFAIPILGPILKLFAFSTYDGTPIGKFLAPLPDVVSQLNNRHPLIYIGLLLIPLCHFLLFKTTIGLRWRVIGEHPQSAATAGINVVKYQYYAVVLSGALAGFGGAVLAVGNNSIFKQGIVGGRGFIALAAMIFGKWTVIGSALASMLFGYFFSLQISLAIKVKYFVIPPPFVTMIPFVVAIMALAGFIGRARPPKHIGKAYDPQEE